jgi:hypothetical protein
LEDETFQIFHYFELGVSSSDAVPYLETDLPLAWALASLARRPPTWSRVRHKLECLVRIAGATNLDPKARFLLTYCVETYLELDDAETEELKMLAEREERHDVLEILDSGMTWFDRLRAQGRHEGVEEGLAQGREEGLFQGREEGLVRGREEGLQTGLAQGRARGMRETVLRLLERRFGALPGPMRQRLECTVSGERLEEIADRLFTAQSLDDLGL